MTASPNKLIQGAGSAGASPAAASIFAQFISRFGAALEHGDLHALSGFMTPDCHWKDLLALTGSYPVFIGPEGIRAALERQLPIAGISDVRPSGNRAAPRFHKRAGRQVLEGYFDFDTRIGKGAGFVRLLVNADDVNDCRIWCILTSLQELRGHEERVNDRRPVGDEFSQYKCAENWGEVRNARRNFVDRDPEVVVVGAGHCGLILATRLGLMGVDTLVIEREDSVGDTWRKRYHSLTLHNESFANHMPYIPFPPSFPVWLSKDQLADWMENYSVSMDCNVWTGTTVSGADFDHASKTWTVHLQGDGTRPRTIRCKHVVFSTGVSGSIPRMPAFPGVEAFGGEVLHSSQFTSGRKYAGKRVLVVGTGNSGHDVAQDLVVNGACKVDMLQRGPACIVSLKPTATAVYRIYREGLDVGDVDLMAASIPYDVLVETYQAMCQRAARNDQALLEGLNAAGLETWYGVDGTGFHMMYLRGKGGYYINVGCSDMIIDGRVGVIQHRDMERLVHGGVQMSDGSIREYDAIIMATGFRNMQENVRAIMGDAVADTVGSIWGFDEQFMMKNMYRHTAQENFWIMGGALIDARVFSRYLAILITAELNGIRLPTADLKSSLCRSPQTGAGTS